MCVLVHPHGLTPVGTTDSGRRGVASTCAHTCRAEYALKRLRREEPSITSHRLNSRNVGCTRGWAEGDGAAAASAGVLGPVGALLRGPAAPPERGASPPSQTPSQMDSQDAESGTARAEDRVPVPGGRGGPLAVPQGTGGGLPVSGQRQRQRRKRSSAGKLTPAAACCCSASTLERV